MELQKGNKYNLLKVSEDSFQEFLDAEESFETHHLIVEVSDNLNMDNRKISLFLNLATNFKSNGMSFVVVKSGIDIDQFPETLNISPTLQEAEDILEMEAIERDLGF